jgi:CDP-4-dehydro-6-deoxyglucose reductase
MAALEYTVLVEPHGRRITVAADRPILESALSAGLNLPHSCKSGHCASCRVQLRIGQVEYPNGLPLGVTAEEAAAGKILLCQARARSDLVVQARLIASVTDVEIKTLPCRIARVTPLAPDVMQVFLRLPVVERLEFHPGQYLDILLDGGRRRSFSIASPPHDSDQIELHVRRVPGGGFTDGLWSSTGVGSLLRIEGPIGQFVYREGSAPMLMIAGGTGFAPLKSMLRHVLERGIDRPIHLYWGARQAQDLYEEALVLEWIRRYPQLRFTAVLSEATGTDYRAGWVHEAVLADYPNIESFDVYAAGPPAMVEAIKATFSRQDRLYFDSFDYAVDDKARASDTKPLA